MSGKAQKKKKSATKFRKAPQAPKRGKSAFILFSIAKHPEMRKTLDDGSTEKAPSVARRVSEAWRNLSIEERAIWEARAHDDKMRYEAEKSAYTGPWKLPLGPKRAKKDPNAPKRPMSAFLAYSKSMRRQVKRDNPDMSNIQVSKVLADMWKAAPDHERSVYIDQEAKERAVYKVAMNEWRTAREAEMAMERKRREAMARDAIARSNTHAMSNVALSSSYQQTATSQYVEKVAPNIEDVSFANATHAYAMSDSGSHTFNPSLNKAHHFGPSDSQNQFPHDTRSEKIVGYSPLASSAGVSSASPSELHRWSHRPLGIPSPENSQMQYHMQAERGQHHASPGANIGGYFDGMANIDNSGYSGYYWPASNRNVGYSSYSPAYSYPEHSTSSASHSQFGFPGEQAPSSSSYSQSFPGSVQQRDNANYSQDASCAQLYYHRQLDPYRVQQDAAPQASRQLHPGLQEGWRESAADATSPLRTNATSQPFVSDDANSGSNRDGYHRGEMGF